MTMEMNAQTVKSIRLSVGESQPDFAKRLGCHWVQVSRWENGHQAPSPVFTQKLRRLAQRKGMQI